MSSELPFLLRFREPGPEPVVVPAAYDPVAQRASDADQAPLGFTSRSTSRPTSRPTTRPTSRSTTRSTFRFNAGDSEGDLTSDSDFDATSDSDFDTSTD